MTPAVVLSGVRTPIGRFGGALRAAPVDQLARLTLQEALRRGRVEPHAVEQVILGQCYQSTEQTNVARLAALQLNLPVNVFGYTLDARCASGLQAIVNAVGLVERGAAQVVLAGGVENVSSVMFYAPGDLRWGHRRGPLTLHDPLVRGRETMHPAERFGVIPSVAHWGNNMALEHDISRLEQDEWALRSHQRACTATAEGRFQAEIIGVPVVGDDGQPSVVTRDENPRPEASLDALLSLPALEGGCTAGNIAVEGDAAAACLVVSRSVADELGVEPLGTLKGSGAAGCDPRLGGNAVPLAVERALMSAGVAAREIQLWEIHEVCAAQTLSNLRVLGIEDTACVNVNGSAISLGHPIGAAGARVAVTLLYEMRRREARLGLQVMPAGGGMALACVFERG